MTEFEELGVAFWENTKAARLVLAVEVVAHATDDKVLCQLAKLFPIMPQFRA
jgi:hypothetical protein